MVNLIKVLDDLGVEVTYFPQSRVDRTERQRLLRLAEVTPIEVAQEKSVARHLRRSRVSYGAAILCRLGPAESFLPALQRLSPETWTIFDTVDLHHLRELRQSEVEGDPVMRANALRVRQRELRLVESTDATIVVSTVEREILRRQSPESRIRIVPTIHQIGSAGPDFEARSGIVFLAGFDHAPNVDAARWLVESIMPQVWEQIPNLRLTLVGSHPPPLIQQLASTHVEVTGWVPEIQPYLDRSRLSVAPLRFGAGVKGKITQCLAAGLPTVATGLATEGMPIEAGRDIIVAEGARDLAQAIVRTYRDKAVWHRLAVSSRDAASRHFSFDAARQSVSALLNEISLPVDEDT